LSPAKHPGATLPGLDPWPDQEICRLECSPAGTNAGHIDSDSSPADCDGRLAVSSPALRRQHSIDGTETERSRTRARRYHGKDADALGTRAGNDSSARPATVA